MKRNIVKMSLVAGMLLGTNAYAGKIITDADLSNVVVEASTQFGFGGWNLDNVNVRMVNAETGAATGGIFNELDGTYDAMAAGESFDSDILGGDDNVTVMGELHGKDWPVGEPAGIKIINGDTKTQHGKPVNCIMTTSYLDTGYLDTVTPEPVLCSSDWQTHKRFKVNLLETTVANVADGDEEYGKPVDLVFNLDPNDTNTTVRKYQVLQKINNYSGKRLKGYKIEVLDENGSKCDTLTLSLGEGEGVDENGTLDDSDIWGTEDMANMSHGLWGPYEENKDVVRFDNGFFDFKRAYYPVVLSDNNHTISYTGAMLGGNYQDIFGNWLPSIWEPMGIFHDDDQDPETDGILKAFFGTAPGHTEDAWYKSTVTNPLDPNPTYAWSLATDADFLEWSGDWYDVGAVEDVLNLGVNYIVNIGENAAIGDTFIIRITPYVDSNQTAPSYVGKDTTIPDVTPPSTGGGGGCTYNPNSKNFDMTFLMLMALGLLYPFRRRFIK